MFATLNPLKILLLLLLALAGAGAIVFLVVDREEPFSMPTNCPDYFAIPDAVKEAHLLELKPMHTKCVGGFGEVKGGDSEIKFN